MGQYIYIQGSFIYNIEKNSLKLNRQEFAQKMQLKYLDADVALKFDQEHRNWQIATRKVGLKLTVSKL